MTYTYTVITDTHGRPWGKTQADFDLGDNTVSTGSDFREAIHSTTVNKNIRLYGNHDAAVAGHGNGKLQIYPDTAHHVVVYGFDCASSLQNYEIPSDQIRDFLTDLQNRPNNYNVIVLTHVPLYPTPDDDSKYYPGAEEDYWDKSGESKMISANKLVYLLNQFKARKSGKEGTTSYNFINKTGTVIGCFSGHIHNSVKVYYKGIYMESFTTNGDCEYTADIQYLNGGLYIPYSNKSGNGYVETITVDDSEMTVNGEKYDKPLPEVNDAAYNKNALTVINIKSTSSGTSEGDAATGAVTFEEGSSNYPKFRKSRYVGFSTSSSPGVADTGFNNNNGYWYLNNVTLNGIGVSGVTHIRFDASGLLRYYSKSGSGNNSFIEIPNYQNVTITFTTNNGYTWTFRNGLYNGYVKA